MLENLTIVEEVLSIVIAPGAEELSLTVVQETLQIDVCSSPDVLLDTVYLQGPDGPPGASGSGAGSIEVPFSWGDASPKPVFLVNAGSTVFRAAIVVQVAFNGIGSKLQIGDVGQSDRLMAATQNDPLQVATFETNPGLRYQTATQIFLAISPGEGCSQGSGYILLEV